MTWVWRALLHVAGRRGLLGVCLGIACLAGAGSAVAHNLPYAVVDVRLGVGGALTLEVRCHLTALIAGASQTDQGAGVTRRVLEMSDGDLAKRADLLSRQVSEALTLRADGRVIDGVQVQPPGPEAIREDALIPPQSPRTSAPLVVRAHLPPEAKAIDVSLPPALGPAVLFVHYPDGSQGNQPVAAGMRSAPIRLAGARPIHARIEAAIQFVGQGFQHILPGGLDHILFIVALAMGAPRLAPLIKLATTFTVAHSITLSLAATGVVHAPGAVVEPAITLSIAAAALLSLRQAKEEVGWGRIAVVFGFGLLHGLGFASALAETGLPQGAELTALAAFNLGIELAQIAVILAVLGLLWIVARLALKPPRVAQLVNVSVALTGLAWTAQRLAAVFAPAGFG